jgi:hypothetical protein
VSDLGGIWGAVLLSDQISTDRMLDSFRRARQASELTLNDAAWRNQYDNLVNQYNRLLTDANRLADVHDRERAVKDAQIAELTAANSAHLGELQRLATELAAAKEAVKFLHGTIREVRGETYPSVFEDE